MEQDQYEARLKELFDSFDATGTGSLGQEELTDLCVTLQLEDVASSLQQALLQDNPHGRVHFDQFKEALIDELSSKLSDKDSFEEADCSPEVQPKYIKDGKKYGRRSVPELQDSLEEFDEDTVIEPEDEGTRSSQVSSRNCEELWKSQDGEEYEAEGQLRFWNPDDLGASQTNFSPSQDWMEEKLQLVCDDLGITRDGHLNRKKLISICEQYGFQNIDKETLEDAFQNLDQDDTMSFQDFFSKVCRNTKPLTPSVSTPYRHFKRHLSMQPYDESGRRTITPLTMTGCVGFSLFSKLDDGTGYGSVEDIIDLWQEDGVENGQAIIKALDFNVEGKINLSELTLTLENELLMTKNEVYQAALTSFRSEIRHLLESAEQVAREKDKLRSDLEKNERFKSLMASEVDDHHAAIERRNEYNLSKLDEEYKERTSALRSELRKEREQILQLSSRQRQELEQELDKVKTEENVLRDRLMLSLKESSRLETELLETSEKLIEYETIASKLQKSLDNVLREKFGDLDPSCIEFFRQEEKLAQMRNEYERQRRELQDRIDELQLELEEYRLQGVRGLRSPTKHSLSFEMDSKNVVECDQGIGSEECPPLNMSIEAEMAIEQMREQHQREVEHLTMELESKANHYEEQVKEIKCVYEREKEMVRIKSIEESQRDDERSRILKVRQAELEADIVKLKAEQQGALLKHKQDIVHIEADFDNQRVQLTERETSLRHQLDQTQRAFDEEKEELVMKASDLERDLENKLLEVITSLEMEKEELERNLKLEISTCHEKLETEKNELAARLVEEHQNELQEERRNMNMEYNRRILEIEDHFAKERESAARKHEEALRGLQEKFQSGLQELLDRHAEEKAKWQLEMGELLQERESTQRQLQEISGERSTACSALAEEKDVLENNFSERLSQLVAEKEDVQKALELLKVSSKKEKCELSRRILQLENDLKEELTERDEQLSKVERNSQILQETIEKREQKHKTEKEELNSRLQRSEALHEEARDLVHLKEEETLVEMANLQSTISKLQEENKTLSKFHNNLKSLEKENSDLRVVVSRLQDSSLCLEEDRVVLGNLQNMYKQTVSENVRLNTELSSLKEKLATMEHDLGKVTEAKESLTLAGGVDSALMAERIEELSKSERTVEILRENLHKLQQKHKTEKEELNSCLLKSEQLHKEECDREKRKKEEMLVEITTLQRTISGLQNDIISLSKLQEDLKDLEKENSDLKTVVSQLKDNFLNLESIAFRNLQTVHKLTVRENSSLAAEISILKAKLATMEGNIDKVTKENGGLEVAGGEDGDLMAERAELSIQSERTFQILQDELEELKQKHKTEKEELNARLWKSEMLYKEACDLEKSRKADMLAEISTLQSTIHGLQKEIATSSQLHGGLKSLEQENVKLQATVSRLQSSSVLPEEERSALRNLQKAHEQTVKENVQLNADISRLQKKLDLQEHSLNMSSEANIPVDVLPVGKGNNVHGDPMNGNQLESLEDVNLRLFMKTEDHKCAAQMLKELEKCYKDTKTENGHLQAQVQLLQEDLSSLNVEYEHLKESTSFNFEYQEFGEAPITIVGLKMLLTVAKKENLHLLENLKLMELKNKEAVENNQELSSEVSWMQNEIQSMEEIAEASLKLENLYEEGKKENQELKMLILELQENIKELTGKPALKHTLDKEIQTTILENFELSGMTLPPNCESPCPSSPQTVPNRYIVEDCHPLYNTQRMETHQKKKTGCQEQALHTKPTVVKENIQKEEGTIKILKAEIHDETLVDEHVLKGRPQDPLDCPRCLQTGMGFDAMDQEPQNENSEMTKIKALRSENNKLREEKSELKLEIANLEEECEICHQKITELQEACEEMWVNLELVQNEKAAVQKSVEDLCKQVSELKTKNLQLESQNADLSVKNTKNQTDIQELNQRLLTFRKQRGKKESKGLEEWQREKRRLKDEIEVYKSKALGSEEDLLKVEARSHLLEQENTHLKQEMETKQLLKSSDLSNLKKEISALATKNEHLIKEKETLNEELNISVEKCAKVGYLESKIASLKQEQKTLEQQSQGLKGQLAGSQDKVQSLEDNLKSVNTQISRIRSDLRVAQQEKEALKQEVMSLHKQLQNANAKNQVLEMAVHSSGLQNNQKKLYWNDLEQLMEQEQKLLRQENERLQREVQNTKTDLHQSRDKVRQLESMALSLKHEKQQSHASMVRGLEQEKLSLRRECDQLQKELAAAHRKMSLLDREVETNKTESEGFRPNVGKFDEELIEALHSNSSVALSRSPLQQQASATSTMDQYLQRQQQADRRNQQPHATSRSSDSNSPQSDQEQLLQRMETRMMEVEQKLRIVKMLLQEKVNQLKEQCARNTKADAKIKDLYVENSQLLKALQMSEQRHQTAVKKNYLLEEKISGLNKIVKDLAPSALTPGHSLHRRPL